MIVKTIFVVANLCLLVAPVVSPAPAEGGQMITVKLDGLDKSVKVHRARLVASRGPVTDAGDLLAGIEIYPGRRAAGKPLAMVGPWFDCFDATFDMAFRRLQQFKGKPDENLPWEAVGEPFRNVTPPSQSGQATVDAQGRIILKELKIVGRSGLTVKVSRAR